MKLSEIREKIDEIDQQLLALVNQRARLAQEVAQAKSHDQKSADFYCPERETKILKYLMETNQGPLANEQVVLLFREIISACLALQQKLCIAYLGPEATFTHQAASKHFGHAVNMLPADSIDRVFHEVASGNAHFGVVPVENSTEGSVNHTLDMLYETNLQICAEVTLNIHHYLLGHVDTYAEISAVYAHPQSFAQCRDWLCHHLPKASLIPCSSNAEAVQMIGTNPAQAAIASEAAKDRYKLKALAQNIEDRSDNTTRFLVLGHLKPGPSGQDKTSILFSPANDTPGALYQVLRCFSEYQINMTRIESRPSRYQKWNYIFFVDLAGHVTEKKVMQAIESVNRQVGMLKILGSYPRAINENEL